MSRTKSSGKRRSMAESILSALKSKGLPLDELKEQLSSVLSEEAKDKLSNIFERYQTLNDEEKDEFLDTVFGKIQRAVHEKLEETNPYTHFLYTHSHIVFLFAVSLITLVIGTSIIRFELSYPWCDRKPIVLGTLLSDERSRVFFRLQCSSSTSCSNA